MNDPANPVAGDRFHLPISKFIYGVSGADDEWVYVYLGNDTKARWTRAEVAKHLPVKETISGV